MTTNNKTTIANQHSNPMSRIIHALLFMPRDPLGNSWGLPHVLIGKPGIGKTTHFEDLGTVSGLPVENFPIGERGESELGTVPMPKDLGNGEFVMTHPGPEWLRHLVDEHGEASGIIIIDEVNSAPQHLQPCVMGAILDKRFGGATAAGRVRVVGCMNPIDCATAGHELGRSTENRFAHLEFDGFTAAEFATWQTNWLSAKPAGLQGFDARAEEKRVLAELPESYAWASGLTNAFITRQPEWLHKMPKVVGESGPWPSHRVWHFATLALTAARIHGLSEVDTDRMMAAYIGTEATAAFLAWLEQQDLPNPAELLDGAVEWKHDPARFDRTMAVLSACTALVLPTTADKRTERAEALFQILSDVAKDAKDLVVDSLTAMMQAKLHRKSKVGVKLAASIVNVVKPEVV